MFVAKLCLGPLYQNRMTPALHLLHSLPAYDLICFRLALLTYKHMQIICHPTYLPIWSSISWKVCCTLTLFPVHPLNFVWHYQIIVGLYSVVIEMNFKVHVYQKPRGNSFRDTKSPSKLNFSFWNSLLPCLCARLQRLTVFHCKLKTYFFQSVTVFNVCPASVCSSELSKEGIIIINCSCIVLYFNLNELQRIPTTRALGNGFRR